MFSFNFSNLLTTPSDTKALTAIQMIKTCMRQVIIKHIKIVATFVFVSSILFVHSTMFPLCVKETIATHNLNEYELGFIIPTVNVMLKSIILKLTSSVGECASFSYSDSYRDNSVTRARFTLSDIHAIMMFGGITSCARW